MSRPLSIALISETYPPEVNGVANTLGRLHAGLQQLGHRVQVVRPRQPGDDGRRSDAELVLTRGWPLPGYPGLQWGMSSLHKLLRCWKRQRPDVLYIATEGPLGFSALRRAAPGHPGGQRFPHQLPAVQRALRLRPADPAGHRLPALVPQPHADDPGAQRQPAHGIATARFRTPQPALPRGRQPTLPSLPARSRTTPALGPGRTGHRRTARLAGWRRRRTSACSAAPSARSAPPIRS